MFAYTGMRLTIWTRALTPWKYPSFYSTFAGPLMDGIFHLPHFKKQVAGHLAQGLLNTWACASTREYPALYSLLSLSSDAIYFGALRHSFSLDLFSDLAQIFSAHEVQLYACSSISASKNSDRKFVHNSQVLIFHIRTLHVLYHSVLVWLIWMSSRHTFSTRSHGTCTSNP